MPAVLKARIAGEVAFVAFLPIVLFFLYRISPINQAGAIDAWVYAGYINNFDDLFRRYGLTYYSVRFGMIFPARALNFVLGPVAGYFTFCYLMYLLAGIPVYLLFRKHYTTAIAMMAYSILVSNIWFAGTVLWTYPVAAAVPYLLAAYALLLLDPRPRRVWYVALGVLFGLAVNAHFFALAIAGLCVAPYFILHWGTLKSRIISDALCAAAGFFAVYALGVAVFAAMFGVWDIHSPTFQVSKWSLGGGGQEYRARDYGWMLQNYDLYLPIWLAAVYLLCTKPVNADRRLLLACGAYVACVCTLFLYLQFVKGGATLEYFYYTVFLFPSLILPLMLYPASFWAAADAKKFPTGAIATAGMFILVPIAISYGLLSFWGMSFSTYLALAGASLFAVWLARRNLSVAMFAMVLFAITAQAHLPSSQVHVPASIRYHHLLRPVTSELDQYRIALEFQKLVPRLRPGRKRVLFWYGTPTIQQAHPVLDDLHQTVRLSFIDSLQSTYLWEYSRLQQRSSGMPKLGQHEIRALSSLGGGYLMLLSSNAREISDGLAALKANTIDFKPKWDKQLCSGEVCVQASLIELLPKVDNKDQEYANSKILFSGTGKDLVDSLERSIYGFFGKNKVIRQNPDGVFSFNPTNRADHLATPFVERISSTSGGGGWLRLESVSAASASPGPNCQINVQDQNFNSIFKVECQSAGVSSNAHHWDFGISDEATKVRLIIASDDGEPTLLPRKLELKQALRAPDRGK